MSGWATIYNTTSNALRRQTQEMSRLQEQASSGQRVLRPSDDPGTAHRIMGLRQEVQNTKAYTEGIRQVETGLDSAASALQEVSTALIRVKELMTQATSGTYSDENRRAIAQEIDGLLEHVVGLANHQLMDKYLFAGNAVQSPPFQTTTENGHITDVTYVGSPQSLWAPVAPGVSYEAGLVGADVFQTYNRQDPVLYGDTGTVLGTGTSNIRGTIDLQIAHWDTFIYENTVGDNGNINLVPGASSPANDTILGPGTHTFLVDADNMTIQMDNGVPVTWSAATTDLKVTNEHGDVAYLDTSGVTLAAGTKTVKAWSRPRTSIDGTHWQNHNISFGDVAITNASTGEVMYVNVDNIQHVGTEVVRFPGTHSVFDVLIEARDLLQASGQRPAEEQKVRMNAVVDSLDDVMDGTMQSLTTLGSKQQALDMLGNRMEDLSTDLDLEAGTLGEADVVQIAIDLAKNQSFYQMTLMSISKMMSMSLLDFLN